MRERERERGTGSAETGEKEGLAGRREVRRNRNHGHGGLGMQRESRQGVELLETLHQYALESDALGFLAERKVENRVAVLHGCFLYTHCHSTNYNRCIAVRTAATAIQIVKGMIDYVFRK